jgi:hypothetical protein
VTLRLTPNKNTATSNEEVVDMRYLRLLALAGVVGLALTTVTLLLSKLCIPHAVFVGIVTIPIVDTIRRVPGKFVPQISCAIGAGFVVAFTLVFLQAGWQLSIPLSFLGAYGALTVTPSCRKQTTHPIDRFFADVGAAGFLSIIALMSFMSVLHAFSLGVAACVFVRMVRRHTSVQSTRRVS